MKVYRLLPCFTFVCVYTQHTLRCSLSAAANEACNASLTSYVIWNNALERECGWVCIYCMYVCAYVYTHQLSVKYIYLFIECKAVRSYFLFNSTSPSSEFNSISFLGDAIDDSPLMSCSISEYNHQIFQFYL